MIKSKIKGIEHLSAKHFSRYGEFIVSFERQNGDGMFIAQCTMNILIY